MIWAWFMNDVHVSESVGGIDAVNQAQDSNASNLVIIRLILLRE